MVSKAHENKPSIVLVDHIIPRGVAIFKYAGDTIIRLKGETEGVVTMKLLVICMK
jgi:hypothetical protein